VAILKTQGHLKNHAFLHGPRKGKGKNLGGEERGRNNENKNPGGGIQPHGNGEMDRPSAWVAHPIEGEGILRFSNKGKKRGGVWERGWGATTDGLRAGGNVGSEPSIGRAVSPDVRKVKEKRLPKK